MSDKNQNYRYPECEKLQKVSKESNLIGSYINWANGCPDLIEHLSIEERLAMYFDIDLKKVDEERRLIIKRMHES